MFKKTDENVYGDMHELNLNCVLRILTTGVQKRYDKKNVKKIKTSVFNITSQSDAKSDTIWRAFFFLSPLSSRPKITTKSVNVRRVRGDGR